LSHLAGSINDEFAEQRCEDSPLVVTRELFPANSETLFALADLAGAAKSAVDHLPDDHGGQIAGSHDATGTEARKRLALALRRGFRGSGLPAGSQKDGPIAEALRFIHMATTEATTEVEPSWAKRYAEATPSMEKVEAETDAFWEANGYDWPLNPNSQEAARARRLESYRVAMSRPARFR
jgi:hypothetical protein